MPAPVFTVGPAGNVAPHNPEAAALTRGGLDPAFIAFAHEIRDQFMLGIDTATPRWMPLPDGKRALTLPVCTMVPDEAGRVLLTLVPASADALDAAVFRAFEYLAEDLVQGMPLEAALDVLCNTFQEQLELAAVRVLEAGDLDLREVAYAGEASVMTAVRQLGESLEMMRPGTATLAVRAMRKSGYATAAFDADDPDGDVVNLVRVGIRSGSAWVLHGFDPPLILEVFGHGRDDLSDSLLVPFFERWLRWISRRLPDSMRLSEQRLIADALRGAATPAFITDHQGTFVWTNDAFSIVYGHPREAVLGQTPRLLQSGHHGPRYYSELWSTLGSGLPWSGETIDRTATGEMLTVRQNITPVRHGGCVTHFLALHFDVSDRHQPGTLGAHAEREESLLAGDEFVRRAQVWIEHAAPRPGDPVLLLIDVESAVGALPKMAPEPTSALHAECVRRLRTALPEDALYGALGGYGFAVVIPDGRIDAWRERLVAAMCAPLTSPLDIIHLRCRCAEARWLDDGESAQALLHAAERELVSKSRSASLRG